MLHRRDRSLPVETPDLLEDGLEANAVLVDRPQLDRRVRESGCHLPQQWAQAGFKLGLGDRISMHVARPRFAPARTEPSQVAPAQLTADLTSQALAEPGSHSTSAPAVTFGMGASQGRFQLGSL